MAYTAVDQVECRDSEMKPETNRRLEMFFLRGLIEQDGLIVDPFGNPGSVDTVTIFPFKRNPFLFFYKSIVS